MTRAHRSLWILTALTTLTAGVLAQALAAPASLTADIVVVLSALLLAISATLLARVIRHLARPADTRRPHPPRG
jgi:predicted anti-sigma-YlaC factor YlaD